MSTHHHHHDEHHHHHHDEHHHHLPHLFHHTAHPGPPGPPALPGSYPVVGRAPGATAAAYILPQHRNLVAQDVVHALGIRGLSLDDRLGRAHVLERYVREKQRKGHSREQVLAKVRRCHFDAGENLRRDIERGYVSHEVADALDLSSIFVQVLDKTGLSTDPSTSSSFSTSTSTSHSHSPSPSFSRPSSSSHPLPALPLPIPSMSTRFPNGDPALDGLPPPPPYEMVDSSPPVHPPSRTPISMPAAGAGAGMPQPTVNGQPLSHSPPPVSAGPYSHSHAHQRTPSMSSSTAQSAHVYGASPGRTTKESYHDGPHTPTSAHSRVSLSGAPPSSHHRQQQQHHRRPGSVSESVRRMSSGASGNLPPDPDLALAAQRGHENQFEFLRSFDCVLLVDDSASMNVNTLRDGTMAEKSRWEEARDALAGLVEIASRYDDDGIDVYFLNDPRHLQGCRDPVEVRRLFSEVEPFGTTPTASRLEELLLEYLHEVEVYRDLHERGEAGTRRAPKHRNIICITDGVATDDPESVIVAAARRLDRGNFPLSQLGIQFIQVGDDEEATEALQDLDDALASQYHIRDIVDFTPYKGMVLDTNMIVKALMGAVNKRLDRQRNRTEP